MLMEKLMHSVFFLRLKSWIQMKQEGLILKSYYRWDQQVTKTIPQTEFGEVKHLLSNPTATSAIEVDKWTCSSRSGYEIFAFKKPSSSFIWEGLLTVEGMGKLGLVSDIDADGNGYFISFDVQNGLLQIRAWGFNPLDMRQNFIFNELQIGVFKMNEENTFYFRWFIMVIILNFLWTGK